MFSVLYEMHSSFLKKHSIHLDGAYFYHRFYFVPANTDFVLLKTTRQTSFPPVSVWSSRFDDRQGTNPVIVLSAPIWSLAKRIG